MNAQAVSSLLPRQRLVGGAEFYFDTIQSRTVKTDASGKEDINEDLGRFINGSQFWDASLYLQDEISIHKRVELTLGAAARHFIKPMQTSPFEIRLLMRLVYSTAV